MFCHPQKPSLSLPFWLNHVWSSQQSTQRLPPFSLLPLLQTHACMPHEACYTRTIHAMSQQSPEGEAWPARTLLQQHLSYLPTLAYLPTLSRRAATHKYDSFAHRISYVCATVRPEEACKTHWRMPLASNLAARAAAAHPLAKRGVKHLAQH